jgi:hypothetical protein
VAFLAPLFLGLAALAGVPLLVHLLRRRIGRVVDFPAVRYLMRMEREHSRERKLKNRFLLLLRLLAVIALALAAARPVARLAGLGHAPVAVAIVLDNSMSTSTVVGGKTVLDALGNDARALMASMTTEDRGWLVTADGRVASGSATELQAALAAVKPLGGRGDLAAAVRRATTLARGGKPRAPVIAIITDGQNNALGTANDSIINVDDVPVVLYAPGRPKPRNHAVLSALPQPARWTPAGNVIATILAPDSTPWRVLINGRTLARGTVGAADFAHPAQVDARISSATEGWLRGSVELDADELRADDIRYFAVRVAPPPTVDVRSEAGLFINAALGTLIDDGRIAKAASGSGIPGNRVTVSGADAVGLSMPLLLVAPSDPLRVGEANRTLEKLGIPWRFGAVARDTVLARHTSAQGNSGVADSALDGTRVMQRYALIPASTAGVSTRTTALATSPAAPPARRDSVARVDTLAMAGGTPWTVAGAGYVILGSPVNPAATDLPLRAAFVPWLFGVVAMRLGDDGERVTTVPGGRISLPADITALESADGMLHPEMARARTAPPTPGVYMLRREAAAVGALVVNAEPEESDLTPSTEKALRARLNGTAVSNSANAAAWRKTVLDQAAGRSLAWPLIALALLALVLESWLSRLSAATPHGNDASATTPRSRAA